jgi:hypothetical protein
MYQLYYPGVVYDRAILATQQWSRITHSDVITCVMTDKDRRVVAAGLYP